MNSGAVFSPDRSYRYHLWRSWGDQKNRCTFVGINPSNADENDNDHTITKCIGFAKRWDFGALDMVNLFAWVDTNQLGLLTSPDPVGPDTDRILNQVFNSASRIVLAWGRGKSATVRRLMAQRLDREPWSSEVPWPCETGTLGNRPNHPLMLPYLTKFVVLT